MERMKHDRPVFPAMYWKEVRMMFIAPGNTPANFNNGPLESPAHGEGTIVNEDAQVSVYDWSYRPGMKNLATGHSQSQDTSLYAFHYISVRLEHSLHY